MVFAVYNLQCLWYKRLSPLKLGILLWFFFAGSWLPEPLFMLFAVYNLQCLWYKRLSPLKLGIRLCFCSFVVTRAVFHAVCCL